MVTASPPVATRPHPSWSSLIGPTPPGELLPELRAGLFLRRDADGRAGGSSAAVHVPLAMLLVGPAGWLPMAARRR